MIKNCNDGSDRQPYVRLDLNYWNAADLPAFSAGPSGGDDLEKHEAIKKAGFIGVQDGDVDICTQLGLKLTGQHRVNEVGGLDEKIHEWVNAPYDCATIHVGWGMESEEEVSHLVEYVLNTAAKFDFPIYIETHRATITQDLWRTVQIVREFPEVRFNGDFSHWYAGLEMVNGDFDRKMEFIAPVLDRTRFIHARIADPGSIQVDISGKLDAPFVRHFKSFWIQSFQGFLKTAKPGDFICFTPELLPSEYYYARLIRQANEWVEEGDRWEQALLYKSLALECWAKAQASVGSVNPV